MNLANMIFDFIGLLVAIFSSPPQWGLIIFTRFTATAGGYIWFWIQSLDAHGQSSAPSPPLAIHWWGTLAHSSNVSTTHSRAAARVFRQVVRYLIVVYVYLLVHYYFGLLKAHRTVSHSLTPKSLTRPHHLARRHILGGYVDYRRTTTHPRL